MNGSLYEAQRKMGSLIKYLKENGYTIVVVGSVGGIPAMAAFLALWKALEPHRALIDAVRTASGSGIPAAFVVTGMPALEIERKLPLITIGDIVEDIGFFAEHNQGKGFFGKYKDLKAYYFDGFRAVSSLLRHATDYTGVVRGENLRGLFERNLFSNRFEDTRPTFEVVATTRPELDTFVFSKENTPDVLISEAVTASCAIRGIFSIQYINGQGYIDAAQNDPIPLESVVLDHKRKGGDIKKLFILGTFIHSFSNTGPQYINLFSEGEHYDKRTHKELFLHQMKTLHYEEVPHLIFEFDANAVVLPKSAPFPAFPKIGTSLSEIRRLIAWLTWREQVERFLRSVANYLYEEMNLQNFPFYMTEFESRLYNDKLSDQKFYDKIHKYLPNFPPAIGGI